VLPPDDDVDDRLSAEPYRHGFHAGNHGDVWKHTALLAVLAGFRGAVSVVDTHAGSGRYVLPSQGEWLRGWDRVRALGPTSPAVDRYLSRARRLGGDDGYPGSPVLVLDALGRNGRLLAHEVDDEAFRALRAAVASDARATLVRRSGWEAVLPAGPLLVLCDPPYASKPEWSEAAELVVRTATARPDAAILLWYPVKRLARPNVLHQRLREAGLRFVAVELGVAPLDPPPDAMVASGVLLVNPPGQALTEIHGAIPGLAQALAEGRWWSRTVAG
jgi:23S rRNA (adenine2030-N6)-methyltransferase